MRVWIKNLNVFVGRTLKEVYSKVLVALEHCKQNL